MGDHLDVVVFGSCNMDLISYVPRLPRVGETIHGSRFVTGFGGKGANQCVAASRLGARCAMVGKLGQDSWGQAYRDHLEQEGINISHLSVIDGQTTGVAPISVSESDGANHIVIIVGANNSLSVEDAKSAAESFTARVLVCQLETPIEATIRALELFPGTSIVNAAPALENTPQELLKLSTIFCVNESEAALMTKLTVESVEDAKRAVERLQEMGANTVIITLGENGAVFREKSSPHTLHARIAPVDSVVDTTGAGDAFVGALAHLLAKLEGQRVPFGQLMAGACEIASMSVKLPGTQSSFPRISGFEQDVPKRKYDLSKI
ncbi:ribokinase [Phlebotomus argentipes]|uniref:ribokinase n=1 Tax=Phlebotomus argentipes TaxID=94469 RepID=UPI002892EFE8|nr:ribokinase [Phlebotomus argentipes]